MGKKVISLVLYVLTFFVLYFILDIIFGEVEVDKILLYYVIGILIGAYLKGD